MSPSPIVGYLACLVAVFCFGSNFVPAKRVTMGDGVFFQLIMCNAIFLTSLPVLLYLNFPEFHSFAMLGGFLWCSGNMLCGPVIQLIGLGLGLLVWGSMNMLMGWASGTFGLFGLKPEYIANRPLNFLGVTVAMIGFLIFLLVKSESQSALQDEGKVEIILPPTKQNPRTNNMDDDSRMQKAPVALTEAQPIVSSSSGSARNKIWYSADTKLKYSKLNNDFSGSDDENNQIFGSHLSVHQRRLLGLVMASIAGLLFGCSFNPAQWIIDNEYNGNDASIKYVFPHFCGILFGSWFYFILYLIRHRSKNTKPYIDQSIVFPGLFAGVLWGIADISWFVANGAVGFSISFPLIAFGPGFVGALWGIILFKEIKGFSNLLTLGLAFLVLLSGLILVGMSH